MQQRGWLGRHPQHEDPTCAVCSLPLGCKQHTLGHDRFGSCSSRWDELSAPRRCPSSPFPLKDTRWGCRAGGSEASGGGRDAKEKTILYAYKDSDGIRWVLRKIWGFPGRTANLAVRRYLPFSGCLEWSISQTGPSSSSAECVQIPPWETRMHCTFGAAPPPFLSHRLYLHQSPRL